jgi:hypothetical protein
MKSYTIKHIHASITYFNGFVYFVVDGRLLRVGISTPSYNDYGEWRLDEFRLSNGEYNPFENSIELTPYNIIDIDIDEMGLELLTDGSDGTDILNMDKFPDFNQYLACGKHEGDDFLTFFDDTDENNRKEVKYTDWLLKEDKTTFEKIFYPLMSNIRLEYYKK